MSEVEFESKCSPRLIWFFSLQFHPTASAKSRQAQGLSIQDEESWVCCGVSSGGGKGSEAIGVFVWSQELGNRSSLSRMRSAHTAQWCLEGANNQASALPEPFQRLIYVLTVQNHAFYTLQSVKRWCSGLQHAIVVQGQWLPWHSSRFPEAICTLFNSSEPVACPGV